MQHILLVITPPDPYTGEESGIWRWFVRNTLTKTTLASGTAIGHDATLAAAEAFEVKP